jgi:arylsulfatase A-like enzyme
LSARNYVPIDSCFGPDPNFASSGHIKLSLHALAQRNKADSFQNVTDVSPPYGGYPKFISQGLNDNYLPVWLQAAGYNTYYTGKLFNSHTVDNYNKPYVNGFTSSDFLLDPYTYNYKNPAFQHNKHAPVYHKGNYSTDLVANKTFAFIEEAAKGDKPFFLVSAPIAPHSNGRPPLFTAPVSAERHKDLFKDVKVPRTANFNPGIPSGAAWVRKLRKQSVAAVDYNDEFYRLRLRALQAVDELVDGVFERLERLNLLDNTYVVYSSGKPAFSTSSLSKLMLSKTTASTSANTASPQAKPAPTKKTSMSPS